MDFNLFCFIGIALIFYRRGGVSAATVEQLMSAGKLMRDICQPKFKVSDEIADGIKDGKVPVDKAVKCYINCVLEMTQTLKKGKYQWETALKQIDLMLPEHMKEDYRNGMVICKDAANGIKDPCDIAVTLLLCFKDNVPTFMFP